MQDGLYEVDYKQINAGFYIENGRLLYCAPVLRKRFDFWKTIAKKVLAKPD